MQFVVLWIESMGKQLFIEFLNQLGPCVLFIMRLKSTLSILAAGVLIYFNAANLKQSKIASSPFHELSNDKPASLEATLV